MKLSLVGFALSLASFAASAQVQFLPVSTQPVGDDPFGALLVDFSGDGTLDLVVSSDGPDKLQLFVNSGFGPFGPPAAVSTGNGSKPQGVVAGDFDADGQGDLLVALFGADSVRLLRGQPGGGFVAAGNHAVGQQPVHLVAADFDNDGFLDTAVQNQDSGDASVLLNDGAGGFSAAVHHPVGLETRDLAAGDLTGDGQVDFVVTSRDDLLLRFFVNTGEGAFGVFVDQPMGGFLKPHGVTMVDVDHDEDLDLFVSADSNSPAFATVSVFKNSGSTELDGPVNGQCGGVQPAGIVAADFDLDGNADVAQACTESNQVSMNKGDGYFFFFAPVTSAVGSEPEELVAGDLDGNGSPDLVVVNGDSNTVSVLRNAKASAWTDLGHALAGAAGLPALSGVGQLASGSQLTIELQDSLPGTTAWLVTGLAQLNAPFKGGTLVPQPQVLVALPTGAGGGFTLSTAWPAGVPGGTTLVMQAWIADGAAVKGFAASNAVKGLVP